MACSRLKLQSNPFSIPIRSRAFPPSSQISLTSTTIRYAQHQAQGRANGVKDNKGRRLGAKKTGGEFVVPGNIIFRQRGTLWHPGENVDVGRDHTIYATEKGYVRYYRDPLRHPKRRYIGVALDKTETLPTPFNAPRRRRLNMIAVPFKESIRYGSHTPAENEPVGYKLDGKRMPMRSNYMFKEANWQIGREIEKSKVKPFKKNDRWLAWKKRSAKADYIKQLNAIKRATKAQKAMNKVKGMEIARQRGLEKQAQKDKSAGKGQK